MRPDGGGYSGLFLWSGLVSNKYGRSLYLVRSYLILTTCTYARAFVRKNRPRI